MQRSPRSANITRRRAPVCRKPAASSSATTGAKSAAISSYSSFFSLIQLHLR